MSTYFISHASPDRSFVESEITDLLTALGIDYWYSKENILTGEKWERSIKTALETSDGLLIVMSPASADSEWVKDELGWAINNMPGKVIPLLYKACDLGSFHIRLPRIQYVDFTDNMNIGRNKLIRLLINIEHEATSRVGTVNGTWKGTIHQDHYMGGGQIEYPVELKLKVSDKGKFEGSVSIVLPPGDSYFRLTGGFLYEHFIQFSYHSTDPGTIQFGASVLELNPVGDQMRGKWIGFGAQSQAIVNGEVWVAKSLNI